MTPTTRRPVLLAATPDPGPRLPWGDRVHEVVPAALTSGAFTIFAVHASATPRRPAYVDHAADEAFVVLGGSVTITVPGHEPFAELRPGTAVYVPRGVPRSFRTGPGGARLLLTQTPGHDAEAVRRLWPVLATGPGAGTCTALAAALRTVGIELLPIRESPPHPPKEHL